MEGRVKALEESVRDKEEKDKERDLTLSDLNDDVVDCKERLAVYDGAFKWLIQDGKTYQQQRPQPGGGGGGAGEGGGGGGEKHRRWFG